MKGYFLIPAVLFGILFGSVKAQITLEQVYPGARLGLYMVNLEYSGMKYVVKSNVQGNRFLKFYHLNHSLWKTIDCDTFPTVVEANNTIYDFDAIYISESIFDCDSNIEFLYCSKGGFRCYTGIYSENGVALLRADSCAPLVRPNTPQQFRPMYNTPNGAKLILSKENGDALVYNIPCSLSTGIDQLSASPIDAGLLKAYPNPSFYESRIEFKLPEGIAEGEILISDLQGREIKRYKVDGTFSTLLIERSEFLPGTYVYALMSNGIVFNSQKVIRLR